MNKKLVAVVVGALVFYVVQFAIGMAMGPLIHDGALADEYDATSEFWRPELNQEPPDMGALMPRWIATGLIIALVFAAFYVWIRGGLKGVGWLKGLKFGFAMALVMIAYMWGWSGVFNLPAKIWLWWSVETPIYMIPAGAVLGWVAGKLAPE